MGLPLRYHWLSPLLLEVSVTLPPAQKVVGPPGVMVGTAGTALMVTVIVADARLLQAPAVTTTVESPAAAAMYGWLVAPPMALPLRDHWLPAALLERGGTL